MQPLAEENRKPRKIGRLHASEFRPAFFGELHEVNGVFVHILVVWMWLLCEAVVVTALGLRPTPPFVPAPPGLYSPPGFPVSLPGFLENLCGNLPDMFIVMWGLYLAVDSNTGWNTLTFTPEITPIIHETVDATKEPYSGRTNRAHKRQTGTLESTCLPKLVPVRLSVSLL